jgi:hypothetical protein
MGEAPMGQAPSRSAALLSVRSGRGRRKPETTAPFCDGNLRLGRVIQLWVDWGRRRREFLLAQRASSAGDPLIVGPSFVWLHFPKTRHEFYFTRQELAKLYETNPIWTVLEERLYGGVLTL